MTKQKEKPIQKPLPVSKPFALGDFVHQVTNSNKKKAKKKSTG